MSENLKFYSVKEVANILKTSGKKIYALIRKGEIAYRRIGKIGRIEIPESEVKELFHKYQQPFN